MQAIDYLKLGLIELQYAAADCSQRKASTSDPLERADMEALLSKITMARLAVQFALDNMRTSSDRDNNVPQAA